MGEEREYGRRQLPGAAEAEEDRRNWDVARAVGRREGALSRSRHATNWTAAALIAGVAVTAGYFAHTAATPTKSTVFVQHGGTVTGQKPALHHAVVTSGGSGVTVGGGAGGGSGGGSVQWHDN